MQLLDFTTLDANQLTLVLSWRNHPKIREWMLHPNEISMEEHLQFVESLKRREDRRYFLVQREGKNIGVIDFMDIMEESAELGLYANPKMQGVGETLMRVLIDYAFVTLKVKTLIATVFADNERAKYLYEKFDFTERDRSLYNGREMITMELSQ